MVLIQGASPITTKENLMTLFQTGVLLFSAAALALPLAAKPDAEWTAEQSRKYEQHFLQPENPLGFPEYLQTVTVQYASAEAAEKAKLTFPGLPEEQEIAFSTRWDDVNNRHLKMAELLRRHGMKGTFFLTRPGNRNYYRNIGEKLLGNGCAIGSHTISHPSLPNLIPNEAFRQMMLIRPKLESNLSLRCGICPARMRSGKQDRKPDRSHCGSDHSALRLSLQSGILEQQRKTLRPQARHLFCDQSFRCER